MNNIKSTFFCITVLLTFTSCNVQIKNAKSISTKIWGNCGMCKTTIETAGNKKNVALVDWNKDTKMASITYDTAKTNQQEVLKRIALVGYDSDSFLAPNDVYAKLPSCCQYDRKALSQTKIDNKIKTDSSIVNKIENPKDTVVIREEILQLKVVFDKYFAVKDALVKTDGNTASTKAKELLTAINSVKMDKLSTEEHIVWMKVMKDLAFDAEHIAETKETIHQRDHFTSLSKNMYALIKVSKQETPTYYQFCPMANDGKGANWLSKENTVKNPYYGNQMLTCGKVVETIK